MPIISPSELAVLLSQEHIVLADARSGAGVAERYAAGHLTGAIHVDLENELSQKTGDAAQGGRHPLPPVDVFAGLLGRMGVTPTSHVVIYDDKNGANAAARFWWMLKAAGHDKVQVLDGGWDAAKQAGVPVATNKTIVTAATPYPVSEWKRPLADINAVATAAASPDHIVIDVREAYRYNGDSEPIDLIAGHIPGAVNIPYTGNLEKDGSFLSSTELAKKYSAVISEYAPENIIVHCGSGVTACHTLLALEQAGITGAALYVGSWSEWSRNDRPVASSKD